MRAANESYTLKMNIASYCEICDIFCWQKAILLYQIYLFTDFSQGDIPCKVWAALSRWFWRERPQGYKVIFDPKFWRSFSQYQTYLFTDSSKDLVGRQTFQMHRIQAFRKSTFQNNLLFSIYQGLITQLLRDPFFRNNSLSDIKLVNAPINSRYECFHGFTTGKFCRGG